MLPYSGESTLLVTGIKDQSLIPINVCSISTRLIGVSFDGLPKMHAYIVLSL